MKLEIIIFALISVNFVESTEACEKRDLCTTSDGNPGIVKAGIDCKYLLKLTKNERRHFQPCGFLAQTPLVCCPFPTKVQNIFTRKAVEQCEAYGKRISEEDDSSKVELRVVNGRRSDVGEFPHFASLGYLNNENGEVTFNCAGALISACLYTSFCFCIERTTSIQ
jgi:hypothetical protein